MGTRSLLHSDSERLGELRAMLIEQRTFRLDQLASLTDPDADDPLSSAVPEVFAELAAGARAALADVVAALRRMDEGGYGSCTGCHGPIEPARLEVLPQIAQCTRCQRATG